MKDNLDIRAQFDDVLKKHMGRLLEAFPGAASLPFDLATITSLILLVERESEIETFPESPPEKYFENTLLEELGETGLDIDDHCRSAVQNLSQMGFVTIEAEGEFIPRESTPRLVGVLDNLFPGLPGLNLVAYVLQTIDEAKSGRKDPVLALDQFDQTLQKRGVPFSLNQTETPDAKEKTDAQIIEREPPKKLSEEQKQAYLQRLSKMRAQSSAVGSNPALNVKTLFGKTPENEPDLPEEQTVESSVSEPIETAVSPVEETPGPQSDPQPNSIECPTTEEDDSTPEYEQEAAETEDSIISGDAVTEPADTPLETEPTESPEEDGSEVETETPKVVTPQINESSAAAVEHSVDEQVQAFEESLAMSCPTCEAGKVRVAVTEKGKMYYVCDKEDCNFITWGKPYHFSCLYCKNPFLVEFYTPKGVMGLKCPKATCSYRQDYIGSPLLKNQAVDSNAEHASQETGNSPEPPKKKKKKVVRKKFVRRKR
jgi:hypothetical protein